MKCKILAVILWIFCDNVEGTRIRLDPMRLRLLNPSSRKSDSEEDEFPPELWWVCMSSSEWRFPQNNTEHVTEHWSVWRNPRGDLPGALRRTFRCFMVSVMVRLRCWTHRDLSAGRHGDAGAFDLFESVLLLVLPVHMANTRRVNVTENTHTFQTVFCLLHHNNFLLIKNYDFYSFIVTLNIQKLKSSLSFFLSLDAN